ncbi:MAG: hypothetical protein M1820_002805 [Bogoriella megaspora]|nr:MAG: hypothetical protein M1820_002805 [Bogoriella megaspora]
MPPYVPRKRLRTPEETSYEPTAKRVATPKSKSRSTEQKTNGSQTAARAPQQTPKSIDATKAYLDLLNDDDSDDLSSVDSDDFEDVPGINRATPKHGTNKQSDKKHNGDREEKEEDDEMDWEDALNPAKSSNHVADTEVSKPVAGISISMSGNDAMDTTMSNSLTKRGPSKKDRAIRVLTHCMHVQFLMWHNAVRNSWCCDKEVQRILVDQMSDGIKSEIEKWRAQSGLTKSDEEGDKQKSKSSTVKAKGKGKGGGWGKGHAKPGSMKVEKPGSKIKKGMKDKDRISWDWGSTADRLEPGAPNMSRGDPLLRLLKVLAAYWKKRFRVTAPGLRKQGYRSPAALAAEIKAFTRNPHDQELHGERMTNLAQFKQAARRCEGSRDVGAQLFVALLRSLGLEARLVASLQPAGVGWSKNEDFVPKKRNENPDANDPKDAGDPALDDEPDEDPMTPVFQGKSVRNGASTYTASGSSKGKSREISGRARNGKKTSPILLEDSSGLSSPPSGSDSDADSDSIVDITPTQTNKATGRKYDRDLPYPIYWAEVRSPITNTFTPVDPIVISTVASTDELLATFEPRNARAVKAKQVMAYIVAHAQDGTAKEVTVRYLKKHIFPGKSKGVRLPTEKVPVYNKHGKVRRYEQYDWFKTIMSGYERPESKRTPADDLEDSTILSPFQPPDKADDKTSKNSAPESLQALKASAEFVLERHLRRDEAIPPDAKPVRTFTVGKGENAKAEPVYNRSDIKICKTVESWHKEGRELIPGEQPLKQVPIRAVTLARKRAAEDVERETGEKALQGLYAEDQTRWIIPQPISPGGTIPRNAYGNIDVYVPTMVPEGAVHLPFKGTAKICRRLGIDHAEAVIGFEFGKQRAVPVVQGVVVAEGNEGLVKDAWRVDEEERKRKEDKEREKRTLAMWKKFLVGLRIKARIGEEYGEDIGDERNPFVKRKVMSGERSGQADKNEETVRSRFFAGGDEMEGGFVRDEDEDKESPDTKQAKHAVGHEEDEDVGGGFFLEDDAEPSNSAVNAASSDIATRPVSLQQMHKDAESESDSPSEESGSQSDDTSLTEPVVPRVEKKSKSAVNARGGGRGRGRPRGRSSGVTRAPTATTSRPHANKRAKQTPKYVESESGSSDLSDLANSSSDGSED